MTETDAERVEDVRRYYDVNTRRFERFGQGHGSIHRAVWGPGVHSRDEAFQYPNLLVLRELNALGAQFTGPLHVLDLGCGLGATLSYLAERTGITGTGVTLSGVQATRAADLFRARSLQDRLAAVQASYLDLPATVAPAHLALSIEAFVHGPDPARYFASAAERVLPGGVLVVCDDFLTPRAEGVLTRRERRSLDDVRTGWLANTLLTSGAASALAERAGFVPLRDANLTPYLELGRPRDLVLRALVSVGRRLTVNGAKGYRFRAWRGGDGLQRALQSGLVEFRFMAWRRVPR